MQIDFGWALDGSSWADAGAGGSTGRLRCGPRGLVALLQTRLGLTRPAVDQAVRIAQYLQLVEPCAADPAFWPARSVALDPWSTARQLLRWRDAAREDGWSLAPDAALPPRLAALAMIEQRARPGALSPGAADDLHEVVEELEQLAAAGTPWPLGITSIALHEEPSALPGRWPALLGLLAGQGVELTGPAPASEHRPALEVVQCRDEWTAADVAARFLAAGGTEPLTLLAAADTDVLDRALHRRGLPATGHVAASTDRAAHQVVGLFLDAVTAPVDVHQLAALLDLRLLPGPDADAAPRGLFPARVRHALLGALTREPGIGGPAWRAALAAEEGAAEIDALVSTPLRAEDLRPPVIAERLEWLARRLHGLARGQGAVLASVLHVQAVRGVLAMLDPGIPLSRRTLQQIIDECGGSGRSPRAVAEVAPWSVTTGAAQVRADGGTVLWLGPGESAPSAPRWDPGELRALEAAGARPATPEHLASLQVDAALRGLGSAQRVVAVLPGRRLEQDPAPSALLALLEASRGRDESDRLAPQDLLSGSTWSLAGRTLAVRTPPRAEIAPPPESPLSIGPAAHLLPERLSFSQASTLISCPHHWVLQYALGIRPAQVAALPTGRPMIGTLVHAVVEQLVHERVDEDLGGVPLTVPAAERVGEVFDALVPQLASELDLPGHSAERGDIRARAVRSVRELFERMAVAGLRITGTESGFSRPLALDLAGGPRTVDVRGSRDLDAVDASGRPAVIDLKWTSSRKGYDDLYDTSEAIQLATYAWSLGVDPPPTVGYYLLKGAEFVAADPALDPRGRAPMDVEDSWRRMVAAITTALDDVAAGTVHVGCREVLEGAGPTYDQQGRAWSGARATARAEGGLVVRAYCGSSEYAQLCGLTGDWR
ncbi:PD-(D/E)XK nuclease family protein [Brachybacterium sp. YJGR34]|uniref:PD-(D/E)XK nuclease family protein n=1 Tax=Brachybacterium sp. YJGR34 TaxID=2059911 RepID=UPI000E0BD716|nr:PD-(D/E)XK nuclease family protein [Brachybacterium sp. YJGR34]